MIKLVVANPEQIKQKAGKPEDGKPEEVRLNDSNLETWKPDEG